jgi:hypothetical protein
LFPWDYSTDGGPNPVVERNDQGSQNTTFSMTEYTDVTGTWFTDMLAVADPNTFFFHVSMQNDSGDYPNYTRQIYEYSSGHYMVYQIPDSASPRVAPLPVVVSSTNTVAAATLG